MISWSMFLVDTLNLKKNLCLLSNYLEFLLEADVQFY